MLDFEILGILQSKTQIYNEEPVFWFPFFFLAVKLFNYRPD